MQNNGLEQQIAGLPHQDMKELKALWQSYFNQPAPVFNKATLVQKLAYRMQEVEYGGLKPEVRQQLKDLAAGAKLKPKRTFRMKNRPPVGTRLMREYDGMAHYVTVLTSGFEYQGRVYRSLSGIASEIVGVNRSGAEFFGLNGGSKR
jgi:hypothetical protein